ncbi:hypothetical protein CLF_111709 [Clonorchis sinensis]|uniref:Uncharacterized protein n=1 Tax=Clonorchis sinensis TaxID=79923 RepID=G7YLX3_CLOSI|nr:hypothetical protein CLF_111709 [Clonorchis sinensis]
MSYELLTSVLDKAILPANSSNPFGYETSFMLFKHSYPPLWRTSNQAAVLPRQNSSQSESFLRANAEKILENAPPHKWCKFVDLCSVALDKGNNSRTHSCAFPVISSSEVTTDLPPVLRNIKNRETVSQSDICSTQVPVNKLQGFYDKHSSAEQIRTAHTMCMEPVEADDLVIVILIRQHTETNQCLYGTVLSDFRPINRKTRVTDNWAAEKSSATFLTAFNLLFCDHIWLKVEIALECVKLMFQSRVTNNGNRYKVTSHAVLEDSTVQLDDSFQRKREIRIGEIQLPRGPADVVGCMRVGNKITLINNHEITACNRLLLPARNASSRALYRCKSYESTSVRIS